MRQPGADVRKRPVGRGKGRQRCKPGVQGGLRRLPDFREQQTAHTRVSLRQAQQQGAAIDLAHRPGLVGRDEIGRIGFGRFGQQPVARPLRAGVAERAFQSQHKHAQALQRGGGDRGVEQKRDLLRADFHRDEVRQHAALGVEQRRKPRLFGFPMLEILTELRVQQIGALRPGNEQERQRIEGAGRQRHGEAEAGRTGPTIGRFPAPGALPALIPISCACSKNF